MVQPRSNTSRPGAEYQVSHCENGLLPSFLDKIIGRVPGSTVAVICGGGLPKSNKPEKHDTLPVTGVLKKIITSWSPCARAAVVLAICVMRYDCTPLPPLSLA